MKLLSLNTHSWLEPLQLAKIETLARAIVERDVDVVCLQEVNQYHSSPTGPVDSPQHVPVSSRPLHPDNYVYLLAEFLRELDPEHNWQYSWLDVHLGFGVLNEGEAILSRLPILEVRGLSHGGNYPYDSVKKRDSIAALIGTATPTWVVSSHFSWWQDGQFAAEWRALDPQLRELSAEHPVIIAGDFNNDAAIDDEGYALVTADGFWSDSYLATDNTVGEATVHKQIHGWEENSQALRIDYAFTHPQLAVAAHEVVFADNTAEAISDHSGLLINFEGI